MTKKRKGLIAVTAALIVLLIAVFWPQKLSNPDFGVTYIGSKYLKDEAANSLTESVSKLLKSFGLKNNPDVEFANVQVADFNSMADTNVAVAQLLSGNGVLYIAEYDLVRKILDDDNLFEPFSDEYKNHRVYYNKNGQVIAVSAKNCKLLKSLGVNTNNLCFFVRSTHVESESLKKYIDNNRQNAFKIIFNLLKE
ncbi:MAG: hypothetical protein Q8882_04715 [Bacillota bacterium]|nr:hypothetical protein [Bacillota bacterium]